jgi:hypothetical protein
VNDTIPPTKKSWRTAIADKCSFSRGMTYRKAYRPSVETLLSVQDEFICTSFHEAAHLVASYALGLGSGNIYIKRDGSGSFKSIGPELGLSSTEYIASGIVLCAGPAFERALRMAIGVQPDNAGYRIDLRKVNKLARFWAYYLRFGPKPSQCRRLSWRGAQRLLEIPTITYAVSSIAQAICSKIENGKATLSIEESLDILRNTDVIPGMLQVDMLCKTTRRPTQVAA